MEKISIYKPYLNKYKSSAIDGVNSEWISNHGKYIELANNKLKNILNVKHSILMSNGTVATHCLFMSLKFMYPNINKIYIPNNVYVAVYNCALMEYNINQLEILKINDNTWNMECDEEYLLSLEQNSAIVIVHNVGGIINVDNIKKIRPDIILIEDNCEGLFGKYNNKYTGSSESILCSSISFYGNKTITSGEGGAFITNNNNLYEYIKSVYSQGMTNKKFIHNVHAYNYRMTNIQAGFLYDQLNDINHILELKKNVFNNYIKLLETEINNNQIKLQQYDDNCERANWMFCLRIMNNIKNIDELTDYFLQNNIEIRPFFYPYYSHEHLQSIFSKCNDNCEILNQSIIMLPSFPELKYEQQIYIVNIIKQII